MEEKAREEGETKKCPVFFVAKIRQFHAISSYFSLLRLGRMQKNIPPYLPQANDCKLKMDENGAMLDTSGWM